MLALTSLDIALAGVLATAFVGLVGPLVGAWIAQGNRQHERQLATDERIFQTRSDAYADALRDARKDERLADEFVTALTKRKGDLLPDAGAFGDPKHWDDLQVRVSLFGSHEAVKQYKAVHSAFAAFFTHLPDSWGVQPSDEWLNEAIVLEQSFRAS
jgi:hypothetical protein